MKIIFFDLDDTLYERQQPFAAAWKTLFPDRDPAGIPEAFRCCRKRGDEVFLPSQNGEITMEEMYTFRYQQGFADVGIEISKEEALHFKDIYQERQRNLELDPAVAAVLAQCREKYDRLGIITNGPGAHQLEKIEALGLMKWMDPELVLISGYLGIDKPDLRIFEEGQRRAGVHAEEITYVGDSAENDYEPARKIGWRAILHKGDWQETEKFL